ncbi:MAG: hypothetical protein ACI9U6_000125 [Loktanella salsilacus]|jgi:hypothetical protein
MIGHSPMIHAWAQVTDGHAIAAQSVRHEDAWHTPSLHPFHQETLGGMGISAALRQDLQHVSVCIDCSQKPIPADNYPLKITGSNSTALNGYSIPHNDFTSATSMVRLK